MEAKHPETHVGPMFLNDNSRHGVRRDSGGKITDEGGGNF